MMNQHLETYLNDHRQAMAALLRQLVNINSGSFHKAGVDAVGRVIAGVLTDEGLTVTTVHETDIGDQLVFRTPRRSGAAGQILLVGHMDTVFAADSDFTTYREDGAHAFGPGIIDMKGGLVAGIYAIKALNAAGVLDRLPLVFVCNSDEEIGSVRSKPLIMDEAERSACAFVLECGGPGGEVVTARKGNLSARLTVRGRAGHAAFAGTDKASAILEMAHQIIAVEALNNPAAGISANAGTVRGGIGPNTVPDHAEARLDLRFNRPKDADRLTGHLRRSAAATTVKGTSAVLEILSGRPPMPASRANRELFTRVAAVARDLGIPIGEESRSGVSDANFIAQTGTPVIDGMGPIGGGDHSPAEYMIKASLPARTLLLAGVLADMAKTY